VWKDWNGIGRRPGAFLVGVTIEDDTRKDRAINHRTSGCTRLARAYHEHQRVSRNVRLLTHPTGKNEGRGIMEYPNHAPRLRSDLLRDAALTFTAVIFAFVALDDITTDSATSFVFERFALACCGVWLLVVAVRLVRGGHRVLGGVSVVLVAAGAEAQLAIGPGTLPSLRFEYVATVAGLLWFVGLAGILAGLAWRSDRRHAA